MTMSMEEEMVTREQGRGTYYRFSLLSELLKPFVQKMRILTPELEAAT